MSDPSILFVMPQAISQADKDALREVGVIVVEVADPTSVKFCKAAPELSGSEILTLVLTLVLRAISRRDDSQTYQFIGDELTAALLAKGPEEV